MLFKHCTRNVNFCVYFNKEVLEYSLQTLDEETRKVMKRRIRKQNIIVSYLSSKRNALITVYTSLKASWCNILNVTWQLNHFDKIWVSTSITLKLWEEGKRKGRWDLEILRKCKMVVAKITKGRERESQSFLLLGMFLRPLSSSIHRHFVPYPQRYLSSLFPPCFKVIPSFFIVFVWLSDDNHAGPQFSSTC